MNLDRPVVIRILLVLLLVAHFTWIAGNFEPAIFSPDAHGYLLQARLLATEGRTWFVPESDLQQIGIHWYEAENGRYYSHYPFGMPALAALLYWLAGPTAALMVNLFLATLTLLGFFLLCRLWIGEWWALIAVAAMAVNPVFNEHALNKDAHLATACGLVWGLCLLGSWAVSRAPTTAFAAGLVWGFLPTVRYPAALYGLVPLLFFVFDMFSSRSQKRIARSLSPDEKSTDDGDRAILSGDLSAEPYYPLDRRTWQGCLAAVAGALVPIGILLWHNQVAFGAFWKTGYSLTNEQTAFSWGYFTQHFAGYVRGLLGEGAGLFFPLGVAGTAALCSRPGNRKLGVLLIVALVPITALYMAYYWGGGPGLAAGGAMRFLIPTFFLYTLVGVFLLKSFAAQWPAQARIAVPVLLLLHASWSLPAAVRTLRQAEQNGARLAAISRWFAARVEPGSLVIAQTKVQEQLSVTGDWRLVDEAAVGGETARGPFGLRRRTEENRSLGGSGVTRQESAPDQVDSAPAGPGTNLQDRPAFPGASGEEDPSAIGPRAAHQDRMESYRELSPAQRLRRFSADLSAWAGREHGIYWIIPEEEFQNRRRALERIAAFSVVDSLELPADQIADGPWGPGGGFPGPPGGMGGMGGPGRPGAMARMGGPGMRLGGQSGKLLLVAWKHL